MTHVLVVCDTTDREFAARTADALETAGFAVKSAVLAASSNSASALEAVAEVTCVLVVWSSLSGHNPALAEVKHAATIAGKQVLADPAKAVFDPLSLKTLVDDRIAKAGSPHAPRRRGWPSRFWLQASAAVALISAPVAFLNDVAEIQTALCRAPGVRLLCSICRLPGAPSREEIALWSSRRSGDCSALKTYVAAFPDGSFADSAHRRLAARVTTVSTAFDAMEQRLPIYVLGNASPSDAARTACDHLQTAGMRVEDVGVAMTGACTPRGCSGEGVAICKILSPRTIETEVCP